MSIPEDVMRDAEFRMWREQLNATKTVDGKLVPDWPMRRVAAARICEFAGISDFLRALSFDGELRPPPRWPEVDIIPVGGGPGFIACEVRTRHDKVGIVKVSGSIAYTGNGKVSKDEIGDVLERGKFALRKLMDSL